MSPVRIEGTCGYINDEVKIEVNIDGRDVTIDVDIYESNVVKLSLTQAKLMRAALGLAIAEAETK